MEDLLLEFPKEWRGLIGALSVTENQLSSADLWLFTNLYSGSSQNQNWHDLLECLCEGKPSSENGCLLWKPQLTFLPLNIQRSLLTIIHHYREDILASSITMFTDCFPGDRVSDPWLRAMLAMLREHADSFQHHDTGYKFHSDNLHQVEQLSQQIQALPRDGNIWMPNYNVGLTFSGGQAGADGKAIALSQLSESLAERTFNSSQSGSQFLSNTYDEMKETNTETPLQTVGLEPQLPEDMKEKLLKVKESWHSLGVEHSAVTSELELFNECTESQMLMITELLELNLLNEVATQKVCQQIMALKPELSFQKIVIFIQSCLLMKIKLLEQNASRVLINTLASISKQFPRQTVEGALVPALTENEAGNPCADLIIKVMKDAFSDDQKQMFMSGLLSKLTVLSDPVIQVMQTVLDGKVSMEASSWDLLTQYFASHRVDLSNNLKFSKLVLAVITKYKKQLSPDDISRLEQTAQDNQTFMKKSLLSAVKRLSA